VREYLFSAVLVSVVISLSTVAHAQTELPVGIVSVYGALSLGDKAIDKSYYVQLYTSTALKDSLVVQFQYRDSSGVWKNIGSPKTVGTLPIGNSKTSRRLSFSPASLGMKYGTSYLFRAQIYESGKLSKTYDGSSFTFTAPASGATTSGIATNISNTTNSGIATNISNTAKDAAPTITVSRNRNPGADERFKIIATASDDIQLKKIDIYLDGNLVQSCGTDTKFLLCDYTSEGRAAGKVISYYAVATDSAGHQITSESMTMIVDKVNTGDITYSVSDPEGDFCNKCVSAGKGYNSDAQRCESGTPLRSSESRATAAAKNWFFYKRSYDVVDAGKKDVFVKTALPCEYIGLAIATKSTKLITGQEPLPDARSCGDMTYCGTCVGFSQSQCGWDTTAKACKRGDITGSDDKLANVAKGNWIFFSTIAGRGSTPGKSCEDISPQDYQGIPRTASTESTKILRDTLPSSTAKTEVAAPSEVVTRDDSGNIVSVKSGEVEVTVTRSTASSAEPNLLPTASAEAPSGLNANCAKNTACGTCTPSLVDSCGWDTSSGSCKRGRAAGSDDGSATVEKGNWIYYTSEKTRRGAAGQSCEGAGLLGATQPSAERVVSPKESQPTTPSTPPTTTVPTSVTPTETVTRDAAGNIISAKSGEVTLTVTRAKSKEEVCASYSVCGACTPSVAESCGWDTSEGKCKLGTVSGSNDGKSSVSSGTWVWWTLKERRGNNPGLACDELETKVAAQKLDTRRETICNEKKSCLRCTPSTTDNCGWDRSVGLCRSGTASGSSDGKASVSEGNWVWYTTKSSRGSNPGLSCEEI